MVDKNSDEPIEVEFEIVDEGGNASKRARSGRQKPSASSPQLEIWKAKLIVWSIIIGGIVLLGLILFFFAALFIYFFIPIMVIAGIWFLIKNLLR